MLGGAQIWLEIHKALVEIRSSTPQTTRFPLNRRWTRTSVINSDPDSDDAKCQYYWFMGPSGNNMLIYIQGTHGFHMFSPFRALVLRQQKPWSTQLHWPSFSGCKLTALSALGCALARIAPKKAQRKGTWKRVKLRWEKHAERWEKDEKLRKCIFPPFIFFLGILLFYSDVSPQHCFGAFSFGRVPHVLIF